MRTFALLLLLAFPALAAPVPKEVKRDAAGQLLGLWEVTQSNANAPNGNNKHCFRFNTDGSASSESGGSIYKYTFAMVSDATVPTFKWVWEHGSNYNAIYKLEGDTLAIVFTDFKKPIPTEVKKGVGDVYYELKRVK